MNAEEQQGAEVHEYISPHKEDLLSVSELVPYHKNCRANCLNKTIVKGANSATSQPEGHTREAQVSVCQISKEYGILFNTRKTFSYGEKIPTDQDSHSHPL